MRVMRSIAFSLAVAVLSAGVVTAQQLEYKLLATNKTSTTEKEMQEAADSGYRFAGVMGGETSFGGQEVVTIMQRDPSAAKGRYVYKLLATSKTSTMQKEMQELGDEGFEYKGQTVFETAFGGQEVVVILELDREAVKQSRYEYLLLATKKTSTMQKEMAEAGGQGYAFVGVTVSKTKFGGPEVISILRRVAR